MRRGRCSAMCIAMVIFMTESWIELTETSIAMIDIMAEISGLVIEMTEFA